MRTAETCVAEATILIVEGKFEQAIKCLIQATELDPHNITAFMDLGHAYIKTNKFDQAIEAFNNAISLNPDLFNLYRSLGNAYRFKGDYQNALKNYEQSLKMNDQASQTYDDLGLLYIKWKNDHSKGVQNFQQAIKLDGFNLCALNNACLSYIALGDLQKATLYNQKALLINPKSHQAQQIKAKLDQNF